MHDWEKAYNDARDAVKRAKEETDKLTDWSGSAGNWCLQKAAVDLRESLALFDRDVDDVDPRNIEIAALRERVAELETLLAHATGFATDKGAAFQGRDAVWVDTCAGWTGDLRTRAVALAAIGLRDPDAKKDGG